ncbi:MAG: HAMP domain-containing protein, partial [Pseudomonadota bacterium]
APPPPPDAMERLQYNGTRIVNRIEATVDTLELQNGEIQQEAVKVFWGLALVDITLLVAGFFGVHFRIVRPLHALCSAAQGIASGRYQERVGFRLHDEIGQLAQAFNRMADEVERNMRQNSDSLARLEKAYRDVDKFFQAVEQSPVSVLIADTGAPIRSCGR